MPIAGSSGYREEGFLESRRCRSGISGAGVEGICLEVCRYLCRLQKKWRFENQMDKWLWTRTFEIHGQFLTICKKTWLRRRRRNRLSSVIGKILGPERGEERFIWMNQFLHILNHGNRISARLWSRPCSVIETAVGLDLFKKDLNFPNFSSRTINP